jgi:phage terminase large subunit-like protein
VSHVIVIELCPITATPAATIDYAFVAKKLGELSALYDIQAVAFDRWRIEDMRRELDAVDVEIVLKEHAQGFKEMDPAIEALEDDLLEKRLRHANHPVLTWCIGNVRVEKNAGALRMLSKRKATGRIDGAVALAMACNLSVSFVPELGASW